MKSKVGSLRSNKIDKLLARPVRKKDYTNYQY